MPGASSGILLGAVTLPALLLSKLTQLSRGFSPAQVNLEELHYLKLQYWATSATSLCVLVFLSLVLLRHAPFSRRDWGFGFTLCFLFLQAVLCFLALAATSQSGLHLALKLSWAFCHGLVAVKLIQHFLRTFPSCASIGEVLLVTAGIVLYFGDTLLLTVTKGTFLCFEPSKRLTLCTYWVCVIYVCVFRFYDISKNSKIERILLRKYNHLMAVLMFLPALIFQPKFLDLAFGPALAVFLTLEIIRASIVGHKHGVLRWSKSGKKMIEGTAAGITSVLAACSLLLPQVSINWICFYPALVLSTSSCDCEWFVGGLHSTT